MRIRRWGFTWIPRNPDPTFFTLMRNRNPDPASPQSDANRGHWNTEYKPSKAPYCTYTPHMWASTVFNGSTALQLLNFIQLRIPFCFWCAPGSGTGFTLMWCGSGSGLPKWCGSKRIQICNTVLMPIISYVLSVLYSAMYGVCCSNIHIYSTYKINSLLWFILFII
jgi:hypothetical protein